MFDLQVCGPPSLPQAQGSNAPGAGGAELRPFTEDSLFPGSLVSCFSHTHGGNTAQPPPAPPQTAQTMSQKQTLKQ